MPLTRISVPQHLSRESACRLADAVHQGLVATCGVPDDDRFQLISQFSPDFMIINPTFGGVSRTRDCSIVEVLFLRGRTDDQKRALYRAVVRGAQDAGFSADDVFVSLSENEHIDWSLGGGSAYKHLSQGNSD